MAQNASTGSGGLLGVVRPFRPNDDPIYAKTWLQALEKTFEIQAIGAAHHPHAIFHWLDGVALNWYTSLQEEEREDYT